MRFPDRDRSQPLYPQVFVAERDPLMPGPRSFFRGDSQIFTGWPDQGIRAPTDAGDGR